MMILIASASSSRLFQSVSINTTLLFSEDQEFVSEPTESSTACSALCARQETESEFYLLSQIYI